MARPTLKVEIAFTTGPLSTSPVWVDVTADLREGSTLTIQRGRQYEQARIEAGRCSFVLDNRTRKYEPTNTAGAYYGSIVPRRRLRVSATWLSTTYYIFDGYVDAWAPQYPDGAAGDSTVQVQATDGFKILARNQITVSRGAEYSGDRTNALLDAAAWPAANRNVYAAQSINTAISLVDQYALQSLLDTANNENGLFFMDGSGNATFQNRYYRIAQTRSTTSNITFGNKQSEIDAGTVYPFENITPVYDDSQIYNDITVTATGGYPQNVSDPTSQANYGIISLQKSLNITSDGEAADAASWLLYLYANPVLRFKQIVINGDLSPTVNYAQMFGREISDRITIRWAPPGGGSVIVQDVLIEAVAHTFSRAAWRTTWQLSPAVQGNFLVFGDTLLGRFDYNAFAY